MSRDDARGAARGDQRKWEHVFRHTRAGVATNVPGTTTIDLVNPAFAAMHRTTIEALTGTTIERLFPPEEHEVLRDAIRCVHEHGHHVWRSRHVRADGTIFPVLIEAVAVASDDGEPYRIVTVQDMSVWAEAETDLRASEAILRHVHEVAGLGSWKYDLGTGVFSCSPHAFTLHGSRAEGGSTFERVRRTVHPDDAALVEEAWSAAVAGGGGYDIEYRVIVDGRTCWLREVVAAERDSGGTAGALIGTVRDVTTRRRRDALVHRLAFVLEQSPSIVVLTDTNGVIEYVNRSFEEASQRRREDVIGSSTRSLNSGLNEPRLYEALWRTITAGQVWRGEFQNVRANGETYWERATVAPVADEHGVITHYVKSAEDITPTKALREHFNYVAFHDPLTGLPNRALFLNRLEHALAPFHGRPPRLALLYIEADDHHLVGEAWGHLMADRVLQDVARRLEACLHGDATLAHFSGSEFGVLLPSVETTDEVAQVAQRLHEALADPLLTTGSPLHVSIRIGIAVAPDDGNAPDTLLQRASAALRAKAAGPRETRFYSAGVDRQARTRFELEADLRRALASDAISVVYQPRVDLRHGAIVGFEALARWDDPVRGAVPPSTFIPLAEATGLIHDLDRHVMTIVLRQLRAWHDAGHAVVPVAINVSAAEFEGGKIVEHVSAALEDARVPPHWLEIELTESVAMVDVARTVTTIADLRALGVTVAIDDFGAGYASFGQLKRLPVEALKIDLSFIRELGPEPDPSSRDAAVVIGIIALATILGLEVVAEGVETEAQRAFLVSSGCGFAQGYLFGRPTSASAAVALLTPRT